MTLDQLLNGWVGIFSILLVANFYFYTQAQAYQRWNKVNHEDMVSRCSTQCAQVVCENQPVVFDLPANYTGHTNQELVARCVAEAVVP